LHLRARIACLAAALVFTGYGTASVPTPINTSLPSIDIAAFCQGTVPSAADLQTLGAALAAAAAGSGFTVENASARLDSAIAGIRGLTVTGDAATARDALVSALEKVKTELPNPSADTIRAASQAVVTFNTAKTTFCR
jgi:hypothetical protein